MNTTPDMFKDTSTDLEVLTHRSGKYVFQIGLNLEKIGPLIDRAKDAHARFVSVPMLPQVAQQLQQSVIVSSVFGTNTIEGGTLTEDEIFKIFEETPSPQKIKKEKERRVLNIRNAYNLAEELSKNLKEKNILFEGQRGTNILIDEKLIKDLHALITEGLTHPRNIPGKYRNNEKGFYTRVGDADHGGTYKPPTCFDDITMLMQALVTWVNSEQIMAQHPLIRAPLLHYYFERIHPFWDGNGRVGRVLEAIILKGSGMMYAPFGLARSYFEHIDEYFTVFNTSRRLEEAADPAPNTPFVEFFLHRLREVFDYLHSNVNGMIGVILYENFLHHYLQNKKINTRQYTIISNLLIMRDRQILTEVQLMPWYKALYIDLTRRTRDRDIRKLIDLKLMEITEDNRLKLLIPGS